MSMAWAILILTLGCIAMFAYFALLMLSAVAP